MLTMDKFFLFIFLPALSFGEIVKTPIQYRQGDTNLEGLLVYDNSVQTPRPGVLVFPEWWGLNGLSQAAG